MIIERATDFFYAFLRGGAIGIRERHAGENNQKDCVWEGVCRLILFAISISYASLTVANTNKWLIHGERMYDVLTVPR